MVDRNVVAARIAAVRDAVERIRSLLPGDADAFRSDRTAREVVTLNLFVALQECLAIATHWLADAGWQVPQTYGDAFRTLAEHGVIDSDLAARLAAAAGLRNLIAHRYGVLDARRLHEIAGSGLDDLLDFARAMAEAAEPG